MNDNILSADIEARYRIGRRLFLGVAPLMIAGYAIGTLMGRFGVWIGDADQVGRVLLLLTIVCTFAGVFWRTARLALIGFVVFAFGGRAFGFLLVGAGDLTWANRVGAFVQQACVTMIFLIVIQQWDTIVAFRGERRKAGIE